MDRPHENGVKKIRYTADKNTPLPEQAGATGSLVDFRHDFGTKQKNRSM